MSDKLQFVDVLFQMPLKSNESQRQTEVCRTSTNESPARSSLGPHAGNQSHNPDPPESHKRRTMRQSHVRKVAARASTRRDAGPTRHRSRVDSAYDSLRP